MRKKWIGAAALLCGFLMLGSFGVDSKDDHLPPGVVISIDGAISPATADYFTRSLEYAVGLDAPFLVLKLDTPGGLDKSMRLIVKAIMTSPIPVITYVSPSGARAASAGTYILYASHVAAMAPGTNLGAATPVNIGSPEKSGSKPDKNKSGKASTEGTMAKKMVNDASAYIRSLAELRGRNAKWAVAAVESADSLPAQAALDKGVIDVMAESLNTLLAELHLRKIKMGDKTLTLSTKNVPLLTMDPDWRTRFLSVITSPDVAYMLLIAGVYGLFFEFSNPGFILPGVVGGICMILALYAFQMLPISYAGLALVGLGLALLTVEAFIPSFGILGIGGTVAFAFGSVLLLDTTAGMPGISWPLVILISCINLAFFLWVVGLAYKAYRRPVVSGREELAGAIGVAMADFDGAGQIRIHGEIWKARSEVPIQQGQKVKVEKVDGLILHIRPDNKEG